LTAQNQQRIQINTQGVFAWCEGGELKTSEEYQIENGGDPIVLKKYLLKNRKITT